IPHFCLPDANIFVSPLFSGFAQLFHFLYCMRISIMKIQYVNNIPRIVIVQPSDVILYSKSGNSGPATVYHLAACSVNGLRGRFGHAGVIITIGRYIRIVFSNIYIAYIEGGYATGLVPDLEIIHSAGAKLGYNVAQHIFPVLYMILGDRKGPPASGLDIIGPEWSRKITLVI